MRDSNGQPRLREQKTPFLKEVHLRRWLAGVGAMVLCSNGWLACAGPADGDPVAGELAFHDRALAGLGGNGRACADCHGDGDAFQLSPDVVDARFQTMAAVGLDDPLFRPIDADDFATAGAEASDYSSLRTYALIRIRFPLPANIKIVDPSSCATDGLPDSCQTATTYAVSAMTFADVWRSVPSVVNVSVSGRDAQTSAWPRGPNPQGGYQLDGRVDTLENQARAALIDHEEITNAPPPRLLADISAYERGLRATPEPALSPLEAAGKTVFERACGQCHGGPGMSTPLHGEQTILRFHDDQASCPRSVDTASPPRWSFAPCSSDLAAHASTYQISFPDGFTLRRTTSDPGRALLSGFVASGPPAADGSCAHPPCAEEFEDDWQKLEIAPLHGISKTAPYFHNNSAATLEDVVIHYEEVFKRVDALFPPPDEPPPVLTTDGVHRDRPNVPSERAALVAYLSVL